MLALERRNLILEKLQTEKRVVVSELSQLYDVSEETIRRDLDKLEKEGFATKSYGGAVINEDVSIDLPFNVRKNQNVVGKQKMAEIAASLVQDGDHLFLDASTTAVFIAKALKEKDRQIELANKEVNAYKKKLEDRDIDVAGQYIAQRDKAVESARRAHEKYIAANEEVSRVKNKLRSMEKQIYEAPERETDPAVKKEIETLRQKVRELEEQRELEKEASKTNARAAAELISYLEEASDTIRLFASRVCNASPNEQSEIEKKTRKLISEADQVLSSIRSAV